MKVQDGENFQAYETAALLAKIQRENTTAMLTYEKNITHDTYGECTLKIYRAVGNDSGCKREMTRALLAKYEPNVGLWYGDRFEYWKDGDLIETRHG